MTIDEAIKILTDVKQLRVPTGKLDELRACNLGIEALKRVKYYRKELERNKILKVHLLPGETEK